MNRLEELRQKLESYEGLSLDELKELDKEIAEVFNAITSGEIDGVDKADLAVLGELHDTQQKVRERGQTLQAEAAERESAIQALSEVVNDSGDVPETPQEDEKPAEPEVAQPADGETPQASDVPPADEPAPEVPEDEPAKEEASIKTPLKALAAAAKANQKVAEAPKQTSAARTRSRAVSFIGADGRETTLHEVAEAMIKRRERFGNNTPADVEEQITMATMRADIPADHFLDGSDTADVNTDKIEAMIAGAMDSSNWQGNDPGQALTASGGWCAPLDTVYGIETVAGAQRPVRDALPRMGATRGGIRFRRGISLAQATALGATGIWTNATDQTPGGSTKNVGTVSCDSITEVTTNAVYRQLKFGNFRGRADAEGVAAWTGVVAADWARIAEIQLLDGLSTNSTAVTSDVHGLGFARNMLHQIIRAGSGYRSRNRMGPEARLRLMLPSWTADAMIVDLQESQASENEFWYTSRADITRMLNLQNMNVTYYEDTNTGGGQVFGPQTAEDLFGWPGNAIWYLFHEGAFVFLDSGTLDLGLVRDSTLNGKNDYEIFAENFENIAFVGVESMKVTTAVSVNGTAALAFDNHNQLIS